MTGLGAAVVAWLRPSEMFKRRKARSETHGVETRSGVRAARNKAKAPFTIPFDEAVELLLQRPWQGDYLT